MHANDTISTDTEKRVPLLKILPVSMSEIGTLHDLSALYTEKEISGISHMRNEPEADGLTCWSASGAASPQERGSLDSLRLTAAGDFDEPI